MLIPGTRPGNPCYRSAGTSRAIVSRTTLVGNCSVIITECAGALGALIVAAAALDL